MNKNKLDEFLDNYNREIPLIFYGCGGGIIGLPELFANHNINVVAICDRDTEKQGGEYCGIPIMSFEDAMNKFDNFNVYICVSNYFDEIETFLKRFISGDRIFAFGRKKNMTLEQYNEYLELHSGDLQYIMDNLEDELSRETMGNYIEGTKYNDLECFREVYCENQYFDKELIDFANDEVLIDAGAFTGDTIANFLKTVNNKFSKIYAFEPDKKSYKKLEKYVDDLKNKKNINVINKGLFDKLGVLQFSNDVVKGSKIMNDVNNNLSQVEVISVDELIDEKVTFIKMDIEGSELKALIGATKTIKKYKPKLAICIYHNQEDIVEIPKYIMSLGLDYKYYVRHYSKSVDETVFYAI